MALDPYAIHIYTDGSCYRNPGGESGCVAFVEYPDKLNRDTDRIVDFGCAESTNNRMELMACIKALQWVQEHQPWADVARVQIVTDSTYVTENVSHRHSSTTTPAPAAPPAAIYISLGAIPTDFMAG